MKIAPINQFKKTDSVFENLVDKSLRSVKLKLSDSRRNKTSAGKKKNKKLFALECADDFLNDLPELLRLDLAASVLGVSPKTIYDWKYRSHQRKIPAGLFVKLNRSLLIRTSVLREWIASQNPSLLQEK
jgi:hypothetical protein